MAAGKKVVMYRLQPSDDTTPHHTTPSVVIIMPPALPPVPLPKAQEKLDEALMKETTLTVPERLLSDDRAPATRSWNQDVPSTQSAPGEAHRPVAMVRGRPRETPLSLAARP